MEKETLEYITKNKIVRILTRDVARNEYNLLQRDFKKGEIVYQYYGYPHGCSLKYGYGYTEVANEMPFFQLPHDAVMPYTQFQTEQLWKKLIKLN